MKKGLIIAGAAAAIVALLAAGKKGNDLLAAIKSLKFIPTNVRNFARDGFKSISFDLDLNISNPTSIRLPITINRMALTDNGHALATAIPSTRFIDLQPNQSTPVQLAIEISLASLVGNFQNLLNFSLEGKQLVADVSVEGVDFTHFINLKDLTQK